MTDLNQGLDQAKDALNLEGKDMKKLPQMLNILTILTYIGCGLTILLLLLAFLGIGLLSSLGPKATEGVTMPTNATLSLIISLVGVALCFFGAMKMRNLQKMGFYTYVAGQLLPIIFTFATIGVTFGVTAVIIPVVFIVLYATQLKFLK